jgi:PiT family inorganic phosphate transporter
VGSLPFFDGSLGSGQLALLGVMLTIALGFEFVNGFHDTANAVATVIYTKSLAPRRAVVWSGLCNFAGVYLGGTAVAFSIVHLLPVELLVSVGSGPGMAMVLALLVSATLWNLGTWYLGLPASSSHTLIGAILGVGLANSALQGRGAGAGVNWAKAAEVFASLLISPVLGFCLAALLLLLMKRLIVDPRLYQPPQGDEPPPTWIRAVLLGTCTGVSLAHGSNDGQKGVGLIMLILIGILPARYALDPAFGPQQADRAFQAAGRLEELTRQAPGGDLEGARLTGLLDDMRQTLARAARSAELDANERWRVRSDLLRIDGELGQLAHRFDRSDPARRSIEACRAELRRATDYAPGWVTVAIACALGTGTMFGWKRIVVTVGEKIGKAHLTYAQGAAAEVVAMTTIGLADFGGLPVSTTHVLSSGVAGTMAAQRSGLQARTVKAILLAWALTLPAAMALSAGLFLGFRRVFA